MTTEPLPLWVQRTAMAGAALMFGAAVADAEVTKIKDHSAKIAQNRAVAAQNWDGAKQLLCHREWHWFKPGTGGLTQDEIANYRVQIKDGACYVLATPSKAAPA